MNYIEIRSDLNSIEHSLTSLCSGVGENNSRIKESISSIKECCRQLMIVVEKSAGIQSKFENFLVNDNTNKINLGNKIDSLQQNVTEMNRTLSNINTTKTIEMLTTLLHDFKSGVLDAKTADMLRLTIVSNYEECCTSSSRAVQYLNILLQKTFFA